MQFTTIKKICILITGTLIYIAPVAAQTNSILITHVTAHLGNDSIIENASIGIRNGKIDLVSSTGKVETSNATYNQIIDAKGKHLYPGFIAPNATIGLTEVEAVRATNDFRETGSILPNVRSLTAYNTDSKIIPTVRTNGVLLAQVTPRGGLISGTSSIMQLNGWNWEDAVYKTDDGIHISWPSKILVKYNYEEAGKPVAEKNNNYNHQVDELKKIVADAKAYSVEKQEEKNLRLEAIQQLITGNKITYIHVDAIKEMIDAVNFAKTAELYKMVIVGGRDSYLITDLLRAHNIPVIVGRVHALPDKDDDAIDLMYKLPSLLEKAGILFCLNNEGDQEATGLRNLPFLAGTAAAYGLTKEQAVRSITLNTAKILGIDKTTGSIEVGKDATLFISSGDALDMRSNQIEQAFIKGVIINLYNEQQALYEKYKQKYGLK